MTMVTNPVNLIDRIESLPPFPAVASRIVAACECENLCADRIAAIISEDPALAARILRVANSPFYGAAGKITQVSRAVVRLGTIAVRNLVVGMCACDAFGACGQSDSSHGTLWRHSVASAVAAEMIAARIGFKPAEEAFLAGLLHDIGQLAIAKIVPEEFERILQSVAGGMDLLAAERSHLRTDHAELGVRILSRWGLPKSLCDIVGQHHEAIDPAPAPDRRLLAITMLADIYAELMGFGFDIHSSRADSLARIIDSLGLTPSDERLILDTLSQRTDDAFVMFEAGDRSASDGTATSKLAVWISSAASTTHIGPLLLEQLGYETRIVTPEAFVADSTTGAMVFVAMEEAETAETFAGRIARNLKMDVVLLARDDDSSNRRRYEPSSRVFTIPSVFSLFDIAWVEERRNHEYRPHCR